MNKNKESERLSNNQPAKVMVTCGMDDHSLSDTPISLLCIDDSADDFLLIQHQLEKANLHCRSWRVADQTAISDALAARRWDCVLSDFCVTGLYFPNLLGLIKRCSSELPVILVSGSLGEVKAEMMIRIGASDYVSKENLRVLVPAILRNL